MYTTRIKQAAALPKADNIPKHLLPIFNSKTLATKLNIHLITAVITAAK